MTKTRFLARVSGAEGAFNTKALQTWAGRREGFHWGLWLGRASWKR